MSLAALEAAAPAPLTWSATEVSRTTTNYYSNLTLPTADLTSLGDTDWVYWTRSGSTLSEVNSKSGGSGIGALTASFASDSDSVATGKVVAKLNFTDGTSPASGTDVDSGAAWTRSDWNADPAISTKVPVFSFTAPVGPSPSTLHVWFAACKGTSVRLTAFDAEGVQVGSAVDASIGGNMNTGFHYQYDFGGGASASTLTFKFEVISPSADDSFLEMQAAALAPSTALRAMAGQAVAGVGRSMDAVSDKAVESLMQEAQARWVGAGVDASTFGDVQIVVADLTGDLLALTSGNIILVDRDAAGYGWYIDRTPRSDREFALPRTPQGMDLLTVLMHELGHVAGYGHDADADLVNLMDGRLDAGVRLTPKL